MSTKTLGVLATAVAVFLAAVAVLAAQVTRPGDTMERWEYQTDVVRGPGPGTPEPRGDARRGAGDALLDSRGREGWELVGIARREIRVDDGLQTETFYAFKRPTRPVNR